MRNVLKVIIVVLCIVIIGLGGYLVYDKILKKDEKPVIVNPPVEESQKEEKPVEVKSNEFTYNLILNNHEIAEKNKNYLISPYSIEIALNMLRDGASGATKEEIDKVIGTRKINDVTIKDKVSVANSIFIKNKWEDAILSSYKDNLKNSYNADMIFDEFATPDKINNWVNEKTKGMIPKILENMREDFVLGLANALAIDVEWQSKFECDRTRVEEFTKADGSKINVEMMHKNGYQYIKEDRVEGIVLPYKKEEGSNVELEFVGLIPTGNLDDYVNNNLEKDIKNLNNLIKIPIDNEQKEQIVNLSLPRFTYDSEIKKGSDPKLFISLLEKMGIKKAFIPAKYYGDTNAAEFDNMADIKKMQEKDSDISGIYVGEAIHKTHIELMEKGTKAAAVTYFGMMEATGMIDRREQEIIEIKFNKPFIYMIREKNTNEMLFFGVVYEPNLWKGSTCSNSN